jgi:hypothetical protein
MGGMEVVVTGIEVVVTLVVVTEGRVVGVGPSQVSLANPSPECAPETEEPLITAGPV